MNKQTKIDANKSDQKQPQKPYQDKIIPNEDRSPEVKEPYTNDTLERIASTGISSDGSNKAAKSSAKQNSLGKPEAPA